MVRAQSSVNAVACRAVSNTAWRRIIRKSHVSHLLVLGHYFDVVSLVKDFQGFSTSSASLDSGENEYLVGQRWQCS